MNRFPGRDRFPGKDRFPDGEKYLPNDKDHYPPNRDEGLNRFNYDRENYPDNGKRFNPYGRPDDRGPYPYYDYLNQRFPGGPRFNYDYSRPDYGRYPVREGYPGRDSSQGNEQIFPDKRFRPSSFGNRYPFGHITHNARRPEPESSKVFPPGMNSRYPIQNSRFPNGNRYGGRPGKT